MKKKQCDIFGERLAALRNKKGLTQSELADNMGIQRVTIAKYETGQRAPSIDHLINFAEYFQVSTDYLLGLTESSTTDTNVKMVCDYTGLSEEAVETIVMDKEIGFEQTLFILNWLISNGYIPSLCSYLWGVEDSSRRYLKQLNNYKEFENMYVNNCEKINPEKQDEYNQLCDAVDNAYMRVDFDRYYLIKLVEKLSNIFDLREENKNEVEKDFLKKLEKMDIEDE